MNKVRNTLIWFVTCLVLLSFPGTQLAQSAAPAEHFQHQFGVEAGLSRAEGDAPEYLRQNASDFSTNFGTKASYQRHWGGGVGVYGSTTLRVMDVLGITGGLRLGSHQSVESYEVRYDPANGNGLTFTQSILKNTFLNASPSLGIRVNVWRVRAMIGVEANVFLSGRTEKGFAYEANTGNGETKEATRLDSQDQPVYLDPLHVGGIADYTQVTNRNHGANPVWLAGLGKVECKLLERKGSPVVGLSWRLPLQEVMRSQNPKWSLINGVDPDLEKLNYGTKLSTMSLSVGWEL